MNFKKIEKEFKIIRKELSENWKLKNPSYSCLEESALHIINILKQCDVNDNNFKNWKTSKIIEMEVFKADIVGSLYYDYNKTLVRYKSKWDIEKMKIDSLISEFCNKFIQR